MPEPRIAIAILLLPTFLVVGCRKEKDRPPVPTVQSLDESVKQIIRIRDIVRDAFAAGDIDKAHDPLHEVGHLLEKLSESAHASGLKPDQMSIVEQAKESLFESFGEIDNMFHGKEGKTYDEVAPAINSALAMLAPIAGIEFTPDPSAESAAGNPPTGDSDAEADGLDARVDAPAGETPPPSAATPSDAAPAGDAGDQDN